MNSRLIVSGKRLFRVFLFLSVGLTAGVILMAAGPPDTPAEMQPARHNLVRVKLLAINDFHGALQPRRISRRLAGGAAVLGAYLKAAERKADGITFIVHAGDHVGASPPESGLLQDEPAIAFLNLLSNRFCGYRTRMHPRCNLVGTLGNHAFDEGQAEILRLLQGGNHPQGPFLENPWRGAKYPTVLANVVQARSGQPLLPAYVIKRAGGLPIAFIGAVLRETPSIVTPGGVTGLNFLDEADAINEAAADLRRQGVRAMVVLIHQGLRQHKTFSGQTPTALNTRLRGEIVGILKRLDDEIDVVVSGHAHGFTNALIPNANGKAMLLTQAYSRGVAFGEIDLGLDPGTGDIISKSARIVTAWADKGAGRSPIPEIQALVQGATAAVQPRVARVVGTAPRRISRRSNAAGESALGNLIADAQRAAMGTDLAFMNPGGIRGDLEAGRITWGDLFVIQPFGNDLVKMELTGKQVLRLLEQQWAGQPHPRMLKPSGLTYRWNPSAPVGSRIVVVYGGKGRPLRTDQTYTVTVNSYLADGGDNFKVLQEGANPVVGPLDLDALSAYIGSLKQPFKARIDGRICRGNKKKPCAAPTP